MHILASLFASHYMNTSVASMFALYILHRQIAAYRGIFLRDPFESRNVPADVLHDHITFLNAKNRDGKTALCVALENKFASVVHALLSAKLNDKVGAHISYLTLIIPMTRSTSALA